MNDTISRKAAIEAVRKCSVKEVTPAYMLINKAEAMTELMLLPSADPELATNLQQSCNQLATDCISRQAVKNVIFDMHIDGEDGVKKALPNTYGADLREIIEQIDALPSAEPVRMKGKWIIHETENDRYDDMICPFCKTCYTVDAYRIDDIGLTAEDFNFCPNCGAMMS